MFVCISEMRPPMQTPTLPQLAGLLLFDTSPCLLPKIPNKRFVASHEAVVRHGLHNLKL